MVPLGKQLVSSISCQMSIQTTLVSGIVWPQFAMQVLTGGCQSNERHYALKCIAAANYWLTIDDSVVALQRSKLQST